MFLTGNGSWGKSQGSSAFWYWHESDHQHADLRPTAVTEEAASVGGLFHSGTSNVAYWVDFGHGAMSDLSLLCAPRRTSRDHSKFLWVHAPRIKPAPQPKSSPHHR